MKTFIVANPNAASGKAIKYLDDIKKSLENHLGEIEVQKTQRPEHATEIIKNILKKNKKSRIFILGGDGSCNEAINGFINSKDDQLICEDSTLSIIPVGTGNDFCRTLGLFSHKDIHQFKNASTKEIDVGKITYTKENKKFSRYFVNAASLGCSGHIAKSINSKSKTLGPKLTYFLGTIKGMLEYKNKSIKVTVDDQRDFDFEINTLVTSNARYWAGSMNVSPLSILNDGLLDVLIAADIGLIDFLKESKDIYKGTHLESPKLKWIKAKKLVITPNNKDDLIYAEADGEEMGYAPIEIEILPSKLKIFSPWNLAEKTCVL